MLGHDGASLQVEKMSSWTVISKVQNERKQKTVW